MCQGWRTFLLGGEGTGTEVEPSVPSHKLLQVACTIFVEPYATLVFLKFTCVFFKENTF